MDKLRLCGALVLTLTITGYAIGASHTHEDQLIEPVVETKQEPRGLTGRLVVCVHETHVLYDPTPDGKCDFGGYAAAIDAPALQSLYKQATDKLKLAEPKRPKKWDGGIEITELPPEPPASQKHKPKPEKLTAGETIFESLRWLGEKALDAFHIPL